MKMINQVWSKDMTPPVLVDLLKSRKRQKIFLPKYSQVSYSANFKCEITVITLLINKKVRGTIICASIESLSNHFLTHNLSLDWQILLTGDRKLTV